MAGFKGKALLILGGGPEQVPLIRRAQALNLYVVAADRNPRAPAQRVADEFVAVDIHDSEAICDQLPRAIDGVLSHAVEAAESAANIAAHFGIPGIDPEVAHRATDKIERQRHLARSGIPVPQSQWCETALLPQVFESVNRPVVVKPRRGAGARGVELVNTVQDAEAAVRRLHLAGATEVLVEEFLTGPELSTESLVQNGSVSTFAVADRNYARKAEFSPNFIEDGIDFPSSLSLLELGTIHALIRDTVTALGIKTGAAKGDIILTERGPVVIEMAARTSGGWFGFGSIPIATGIDPWAALIELALQGTFDSNHIKPRRELSVSQRYLIPQKDGWFGALDGVGEALKTPGLKLMTTMTPPANTWTTRAQSHADRLAQVVCVGDSRNQAAGRATLAISQLQVHYMDGERIIS